MKMQHRLLLLVLWILPTAFPAAADTLRHLAEGFDVADARVVRLESSVGEVRVTGVEGSRLKVELELSCSILGGDRCREEVEAAQLTIRRDGDRVAVQLSGLRQGKTVRGLTLHWRLEVPAALGIDLQLGVGDVRITSLRGDIDASVGVGRVEILAGASAVGSVDLSTGVGDVDLLVRNRSVEEGGTGFVDDRLRWSEGTGAAKIRVDCGVGSVRVSLD